MKIKKRIICFISTFEMYDKEESGRKPNTVRVLSFKKEQKLKSATHVRIGKGYTKRFFIREITDKTKWFNEWIISWNPNPKKGEQVMEKKILLIGLLMFILITNGCKTKYEYCEALDNESNIVCNVTCKGECYVIPCGSDNGVVRERCEIVYLRN